MVMVSPCLAVILAGVMVVPVTLRSKVRAWPPPPTLRLTRYAAIARNASSATTIRMRAFLKQSSSCRRAGRQRRIWGQRGRLRSVGLMKTRFLPLLAMVLAASCSNQSLPKTAASPAGRPAPALVQVENDPMSHPQYGLQKADLVYEYLTEGTITRFTV